MGQCASSGPRGEQRDGLKKEDSPAFTDIKAQADAATTGVASVAEAQAPAAAPGAQARPCKLMPLPAFEHACMQAALQGQCCTQNACSTSRHAELRWRGNVLLQLLLACARRVA